MDTLTLKTEDNIQISANHYMGGFDRVIIICPGFMMHKDSRPFLLLSDRLSRSFNIITMDFRGHGSSKGSYTFTSREHYDLRAVVDFALPRYKSIYILGFSLGAAVAINETALKKNIARLMVVSAPSDFARIENRFLRMDVILSTLRKFDLKMALTRFGNILLSKPRPIEHIDKLSPIPVLFLHGGRDSIVMPGHSRSLYERAGEPKRLVVWKDCLHAEDVFLGDHFNNFVALCTEWFNENDKTHDTRHKTQENRKTNG